MEYYYPGKTCVQLKIGNHPNYQTDLYKHFYPLQGS